MDYRLHKLAQYVRGWLNYYGISEYYRTIPAIDHWLRRRVRMCYWKQWRKVRTWIKNLLKIGTKPGVAIPICQTRKSPWKCARTLATQTGMIRLRRTQGSRSGICQRTMGENSLSGHGPIA